jgi:AcrR family transcriptional regulator
MAKKRAYLPASERRKHILETAERVLAAQGTLPVEALCAEAEISRATLYHYFGGPEAVRIALLTELLARMEALVAARPTLVPPGLTEPPPRELVETAVRTSLHAFFGLTYAHGDTILAALNSRNGDPEADAVVRRIEGVLIGALEEDLVHAMRAGVVRVRDPRLAALALFAGLAALVEHGLRHGREVSVDALVDTAVGIQLHGILVTS